MMEVCWGEKEKKPVFHQPRCRGEGKRGTGNHGSQNHSYILCLKNKVVLLAQGIAKHGAATACGLFHEVGSQAERHLLGAPG